MFSRERREYVDLKTINEHLAYCKENKIIVYRAKNKGETFGNKCFIEDKLLKFQISYRRGSKACTYIFFKDGRSDSQVTDGGEAFRILSKYYKVPRFEDPQILAMSASPLLYKNEKYENTRNDAIGYDLNSAYSYAMIQQMPDTSVKPKCGFINEGKEIGFIELPKPNSNCGLTLVPIFTGFSKYVFPLMESPFKKFVERWYNKKLDGDKKAKGVLVYSIGYLQKVNPFLRATIIGYCNTFIRNLINDDTLYCNTDSLVSLKPRDDFKIGKQLGEWKIEHQGKFAYRGFNYQWNLDIPSVRGKPKSWFKKNWDLLKDSVPSESNIYKYENYKIVEK